MPSLRAMPPLLEAASLLLEAMLPFMEAALLLWMVNSRDAAKKGGSANVHWGGCRSGGRLWRGAGSSGDLDPRPKTLDLRPKT
eukprot:312037-Rhodomonas_salina.3